MFRALLWKEWRELWMLPVAAGLLAALAFIIAGWWRSSPEMPLTAKVVAATFAPWILTVALYIPSHLYSREKEMDTFHFLGAKPLDLFRLWWFRLVVGLTVLAAVWLTLYVVTSIMGLPYPKVGSYGATVNMALWRITCFSLILYALSSLSSAVFKGQASALGVAILIVFLFLTVFYGLASSYYRQPIDFAAIFPGDLDSSTVLLLLLCPGLLWASLAIFSRRSLRRQTRKSITIGYAVPGIVALLLTVAGIANVSLTLMLQAVSQQSPRVSSRPSPSEVTVFGVSDDGNRVLARLRPPGMLAMLDISERKIYEIYCGSLFAVEMQENGKSVAYVQSGREFFFGVRSIILSDAEGKHSEALLEYRNFRRNPPLPVWSPDGNYFALIRGAHNSGDTAFVAVSDSDGRILGRYDFPGLEQVSLDPVGWDLLLRFYFRKSVSKRGTTLVGYWRVRPDNIVPEPVSFLPEGRWPFASISPDGRWFVLRKGTGRNAPTWLYDILNESEELVSRNPEMVAWTRDGKMFAYIEWMNYDRPLPDERRPLNLTVYKTATGKKKSVPLETVQDIRHLLAWSPSNSYLLLKTTQKYHGSEAREFAAKMIKLDDNKVYVLSVNTGQMEKVTEPDTEWRSVHWIPDDRLLWGIRDRLVTTDLDGSRPEEIFRVEGERFSFSGEGTF